MAAWVRRATQRRPQHTIKHSRLVFSVSISNHLVALCPPLSHLLLVRMQPRHESPISRFGMDQEKTVGISFPLLDMLATELGKLQAQNWHCGSYSWRFDYRK
ncbi:hypothetical protein DFJ73DRAFT_958079 [Zopfochytrium polystomum]|nr:hypothetical protein DFJ73DRAFT_958079 [Zopfochytrium polystomum]